MQLILKVSYDDVIVLKSFLRAKAATAFSAS